MSVIRYTDILKWHVICVLSIGRPMSLGMCTNCYWNLYSTSFPNFHFQFLMFKKCSHSFLSLHVFLCFGLHLIAQFVCFPLCCLLTSKLFNLATRWIYGIIDIGYFIAIKIQMWTLYELYLWNSATNILTDTHIALQLNILPIPTYSLKWWLAFQKKST